MNGASAEPAKGDSADPDRRRHRRKVSSSATAASSSGDLRSSGDGPQTAPPVTSELRRAVAVVAGEEIAAGTLSPEMMPHTPIDVGSVFWGEIESSDPLITIFVENGNMTSASRDASWMQHVRLAQHCHMQNMQIIHDDQDAFCLQASRTISQGEPLYVWFTLETAKFFRIPFLSLVNIQGGCQYKCHQCGRVYKDPNPLKIHLAFYCVTSHPDLTAVQDERSSSSTHSPSFPSTNPLAPPGAKRRPSAFRPPHSKPSSVRQLTSPPATLTSLPASTSGQAVSLTPATALKSWPLHRMAPVMVYPGHVHFPGSTQMNLYPSAAWLSPSGLQSTPAPPCDNLVTCPSPYLALPNLLNWPGTVTSIYSNSNSHSLRNQSAGFPANSTSTNLKPYRYPPIGFPNRPITEESPSSGDVTVGLAGDGASSGGGSTPAGRPFGSDGKARKKHKCFYCGRLYSRKYGLKIHIRTHTGFKPLNCKFCHRPFGDPSNLNKHIRLHAEGVTPYRCDLCGKVLVRRRDLDRHLKSRHPTIVGQKQVLDCDSPSGENCRKVNLAAK